MIGVESFRMYLYFQDFLNADEIQHLHTKAAIMNLADEVIVNRRFIHFKDVQLKRQNGYSKTGSHIKLYFKTQQVFYCPHSFNSCRCYDIGIWWCCLPRKIYDINYLEQLFQSVSAHTSAKMQSFFKQLIESFGSLIWSASLVHIINIMAIAYLLLSY